MDDVRVQARLALLVLVLGSAACGRRHAAPHVPLKAAAPASSTALDFISNATAVGRFEVASGTLALARSHSDQVRAIAQMIIDDFTRTNAELQSLAARKNLKLPLALDAEHDHLLTELRAARDAAFDRRYLEQQLTTHRAAIDLFANRGDQASDLDVRDFADRTLVFLSKHLQHLRGLQSLVKLK